MRDLSMKRKSPSATATAKPTFSARAKWALVGRKEYDHLVKSISNLVSDLIAAFPAKTFTKKQEEIVQADAEGLYKEDKTAGELLRDAIGEQDESMRGKLKELAGTAVHHNSVTFGSQIIRG